MWELYIEKQCDGCCKCENFLTNIYTELSEAGKKKITCDYHRLYIDEIEEAILFCDKDALKCKFIYHDKPTVVKPKIRTGKLNVQAVRW